jgi:hypothetical protein
MLRAVQLDRYEPERAQVCAQTLILEAAGRHLVRRLARARPHRAL